MPSRPLTPDRHLAVKLSAHIARASDDADHRTVDEDVAALVETAAGRDDLLAEAIGLSADPDSTITRRRQVAAALFALEVPGVDEWRTERARRLGTLQHSSEGFGSPHEDRGQLGKPWTGLRGG